MRTIWKFPLDKVGPTEMREGAKIVHAGTQDGILCLWAEIDPSRPVVTRRFIVVGTGHALPEAYCEHLLTWQEPPFVWHLYEVDEGSVATTLTADGSSGSLSLFGGSGTGVPA